MKVVAVSFVLFFWMISQNILRAQTENRKNNFEGHWYNKTTHRNLDIHFVDSLNLFEISDWTDGYKFTYKDNYSAIWKNQRLVLKADSSEHLAPYCEIKLNNKELIYQCNAFANTKDSVLTSEKGSSLIRFIKQNK